VEHYRGLFFLTANDLTVLVISTISTGPVGKFGFTALGAG